MPGTLMQPLRDEHATLVPHVEALRVAGDEVGSAAPDALRVMVDDSLRFLVHDLIPHAAAEDKALYPVVQRAMGAAEATATMSRDHVEIDRLTHELGDLRTVLAGVDRLPNEISRELRRVLYGLYALVKVHFTKEEEVYLPLLEERLTPGEAAELFAGMEAAAGAAAHGQSAR